MKKVILILMLLTASTAYSQVNNVSQNVESNMKNIAGELSIVKQSADEIAKAYFSTSASSLVGAAGSSDAVTVSSKLTKTNYINGVTLAQELQKLFTNQDVTEGDYLSSAHNMVNGSTAAAQALSQDVEVIGNNIVLLAKKMIELRKSCQTTLAWYNSSDLASALVPVSLNTIVFGCSTTKQKFVDGMNMCQQVMNLMDNAAVTQGDWMAIVVKWTQGS